METQKLNIQQAVEGEVYGDQVAFNSKEFQTKLHKYEVTDLVDTKLIIKQDKEKYIFCINGENKFAVNGRINLTTFIDDFYKEIAKKEKRAAEKKAVIEVSEFENKTEIEVSLTSTKEDLADLADVIKKNAELAEKATDIENVKYKVERLITFFEQEKKLAKGETSGSFFNRKYDRKDKGLRKIQKKEIERRLKELNKIKEQIERVANNKDKKYKIDRKKEEVKEVEMDDINAMDMKMTLKQLSDKIEDLGKEAPDFILARNEIILEQADTVPYYEIVVYDKSDARKLNTSLKKINNEYAILDKLELTGAKRQELSQDLQDLEEYLNKIIDNPDTFKPSEHPFVPKHLKEFNALVQIDPTLKEFMRLNKAAGETPNEKSTDGAGHNTKTNTWTEKGRWNTESAQPTYTNAKEAFEKWGIGGLLWFGLDKTHMKPEQKQFWWGVGNVALVGGMIFVWWKMISSAWNLVTWKYKDDKDNKEKNKALARLLGPAALIMWSHAISGEWPLSLFKWGELTKKIAGIRGGSNANEVRDQTSQEQETGLKYREWVPGATALFSGLSYGEMKQFLIEDDGQIKIDPKKYDQLVEIFKTWSKKNEAGAAFLESIGKNDEKHVLALGLKGIGITRKEIQDDANKDKKDFNKQASEAIARLATISGFMEAKWYNKINSETQYLVDNYISTEWKDIDDLEDLAKRGDVFYKETEIVDQTGLKERIKELTIGNPEKEEQLLLAVNTFYNTMKSTERTIELIGTRPEITFKTYDQSTTINLKTKALVGFTPKEFTSYYELFKVASLTNYIKKTFKDTETNTPKPFHLSLFGKMNDIEFANASILKPDTEAISGGPWWSLQEVSPILEEKKQAYCDYLNDITPKFWKETPTK